MGFLPRARANRVRLTVFTDHHQFYVQDEQAPGDLSEAWTVQAVEDRLAVAPGIFGVGTRDCDDAAVAIEVLGAAPSDDASEWNHVTECSLVVPSGNVVVAGASDHFPDARRIRVPAGSLRARVSHRLTGKQAYRVQLWPSTTCESRVLVRWSSPPPPPPPRATKPPRTRRKATAQARLGRTDVALEALITFSKRGDAAASASVAQLLAFRGQWSEFLPYALDLLAHPDAVYAGNVFTDLCLLLRRAARELDDPDLIPRAAAMVPSNWHDRVEACLIDGAPLQHAPPAGPAVLKRYQEAVADAATVKRFKGKPDALARHVFALAYTFRVHDEMVAQWPHKSHLLDFGHAVGTALVLVRRQQPEQAWRLLEPMLSKWWPVDDAQVAPVELLYEPELWPLLTPKRCAQVLATPRGPEGNPC